MLNNKIPPPPTSWHEFKSEKGHFSIEFPSPPVLKITEQESVIGHVKNHIFKSVIKACDFSVDYSELPGFAVSFTGHDTIYSHATGALLKKTWGKLRSSKDITYQGHSGKHLTYDIPQASDKPEFDGQTYLFLIDKRLYVINAIAPAVTSTSLTTHFLNSLKLSK